MCSELWIADQGMPIMPGRCFSTTLAIYAPVRDVGLCENAATVESGRRVVTFSGGPPTECVARGTTDLRPQGYEAHFFHWDGTVAETADLVVRAQRPQGRVSRDPRAHPGHHPRNVVGASERGALARRIQEGHGRHGAGAWCP